MATSSFYTNLKIMTEEAGQALLRAFEEAERRPPKEPSSPSIDERLAEGRKWVEAGALDPLIQSNKPE
ncbi:MAG: hypothetical protein LBV13_05125 [Methanomassiliicoccaceae archaeon]|nr:hypothetical protein [Methanomassiliicoccaceae archaeon]